MGDRGCWERRGTWALGNKGLQLGQCESCGVYCKATRENQEKEMLPWARAHRDMARIPKLNREGSGRARSQGLFQTPDCGRASPLCLAMMLLSPLLGLLSSSCFVSWPFHLLGSPSVLLPLLPVLSEFPIKNKKKQQNKKPQKPRNKILAPLTLVWMGCLCR